MEPVGVIVHHSLTKDGKTEDWAGIKHYHLSYRHAGDIITKERFVQLQAAGAKGLESPWVDIGYHVGFERINGVLTTLTGRPITTTGAHCQGKNDHLGFCVIGNFDLAPPDDELLAYAANGVAGHMRMCNLGIGTLHRHHEYAVKSCPGKLFPWDRFKGLVQAKLLS
jgi:N-acetylmuramoyl-L-alanine amidase